MKRFKQIAFSFIFCIQILLAMQYETPPKPLSLVIEDFDCDGDNDIILGYTYFDLENGYCYYQFENDVCIDTTYYNLPGSHYNILANKIDSNDFYDIVLLSHSNNQAYITIVYDFLQESEETVLYQIDGSIYYLHCSDISDNNLLDIVFSTLSDNQIGIIYNLSNRAFSEAEYIDVGSQCVSIDCGKINDDNRPDIVYVGNGGTKIIYNFLDGFQVTQYNDDYYHRVDLIDFDNDGDDDIFASSFGMNNLTLVKYIENQNNEELMDHDVITFSPTTYRTLLIDINQDNNFDFIGGSIYGISTAVNGGGYSFLPTVFYEVPLYYENFYGFNSGDMNNDGLEDILFASGDETGGILTILYSDGNGSLLEEPDFQSAENNLEKTQRLLSNYPNPFNPTTTILYSLPNNFQNIIIEIFNVKGKLINVLQNENNESVIWEGTDFNGKMVSSGVYFLLLSSDGVKLESKKIMLLK